VLLGNNDPSYDRPQGINKVKVQGSCLSEWILNGVEGLEWIYVAPETSHGHLAKQLLASQRGF